MIADNQLTVNASWDDRLLARQLKDLSLLDLDFSLELTGFEMGEIDPRITSREEVPDPADDPADAVPEPSPGPRVSKLGDLWLLDCHRVLCGDALDHDVILGLMGEDRAALVLPIHPITCRLMAMRVASARSTIAPPDGLGEMDRSEFTAFLRQVFRNLPAFGSTHFIRMDGRHIAELLAAGCDVYSELKNVCVWVKDNGGMGSLYRSQRELVFVFRNGRNGHRNNVQLGRFGCNRSNVWHYPGVNSFARCGEEASLLALHPTVKAVAMVADAILDCSARGDLVLDAFLGSGTTVMAAERTGRRCYGLRTTGRRRGSRVEMSSSARSWRFSVTLKKNRRAVALRLAVPTAVPLEASHS